MRFADVVAEYRFCAFCGMGIQPHRAFRSEPSGPWYHTEECYRFSLAYAALVERLRAEMVARGATAPAPDPEEQ
jgi:hypothetical protein